jgi:hypothetical protein
LYLLIYSLEQCAAITLAFLALDSTSFFNFVFAEEACDDDGMQLSPSVSICLLACMKSMNVKDI